MRFKTLFWILMAPRSPPHKMWERGRAEGSITFSPATLVSAYCWLQPSPSFHRGHPGFLIPQPQRPVASQTCTSWVGTAVQQVVAMPFPTLCPGEAKENPLYLPSWQGSREVEAVEPDYTSTRGLVKLLLEFKYIFRDWSEHVVFNFHTWLFAVIEVYD